MIESPMDVQNFIYHELRETTPRGPLSLQLLNYVMSVGADFPVRVAVCPSPYASSGRSFHNVGEIADHGGGRAMHGYLIRANDLFATLEFYTVLARENGELIDVTPNANGDAQIWFAITRDKGPDFDFAARPRTKRMQLYHGPTTEECLAKHMSMVSAHQLAFELWRAEQAGVSLEALLKRELKRDALEEAIDRYFGACSNADALLTPTPSGHSCEDVDRWRYLEEVKVQKLRDVARIWMSHPARSGALPRRCL